MSALRHHRVSGPSGGRLAGAMPGLPGRRRGDSRPAAASSRQIVTLCNDELLQSCASERFESRSVLLLKRFVD